MSFRDDARKHIRRWEPGAEVVINHGDPTDLGLLLQRLYSAIALQLS
jgi:hypothetical protein